MFLCAGSIAFVVSFQLYSTCCLAPWICFSASCHFPFKTMPKAFHHVDTYPTWERKANTSLKGAVARSLILMCLSKFLGHPHKCLVDIRTSPRKKHVAAIQLNSLCGGLKQRLLGESQVQPSISRKLVRQELSISSPNCIDIFRRPSSCALNMDMLWRNRLALAFYHACLHLCHAF